MTITTAVFGRSCSKAATVMASSDVSIPEVSDIVIVTIPEAVGDELPGVVEEDKAVLVTAALTPQAG